MLKTYLECGGLTPLLPLPNKSFESHSKFKVNKAASSRRTPKWRPNRS